MTKQPRDFGFGEEQAMLKESARRFMADKAPLKQLREATQGTEDPYLGEQRPGSFDEAAWQEMVQLGWTALAVPEAVGGVGMSLTTAVSLAEEVGRAAMPTPLTATLPTTFVLRHADQSAANTWLAAIAEGKSATLATMGSEEPLALGSTEVTASKGQLTGTAWFVQDLQKADFLLVAAKEAAALRLYAVDTRSDGIQLDYDRIVDLTRDQGRVTFNATPAELVAKDGEAALQASLPAILTLIAADIAGGCEWLLQTTAEYAKVRVQFDRPIGFFQAVKHPLVNMMIATDETRSLVYAAACAYDTTPDDAQRLACLAKASAADTAQFCANRATQLHGGIGFTWEDDVQIYHKRQIHSQQLYGDGIWQRQRLAELL